MGLSGILEILALSKECRCDNVAQGVPGAEAAARFGYTPGSFRVLVHPFRQDPHRTFFVPPAKGPQSAPKADPVRDQVIALRKQNLSIYDITRALAKEGCRLSPVTVSLLLKAEGFARLPRRRDAERPSREHPAVAEVADVRKIDLSPRRIHTKFGGLFLFLPTLVSMNFPKVLQRVGLPGSQMIPKRSFLTEYSCRINADCHAKVMRRWFDAVGKLKLPRGKSFDLDFHTIPFHGEDAFVEKHYVSKRSRRQKGILAFLGQDADTRVFCCANSDLRKDRQNDEILEFVRFWKRRTGHLPEELIFDSKLTTYANLDQLNRQGIQFITLRRRSRKMLQEIAARPRSAWRRIELDNVARIYKTPRILDERIALRDYEGPIRQLTIMDLGHEQPTLLLTNQLTRSAPKLNGRYAKRMIIENNMPSCATGR